MGFPVTSYGATGGARHVVDGTTIAGTSVLQSSTAGWSPSDVTSVIWASDSAFGTPLTGQVTITGYISPTQVSIAPALVARTGTNVQITWGHDDTAGFIAAAAAAAPTFGNVTIPEGNYLVTGKFYNQALNGTQGWGLIGESKSNTIIYPSPNCPVPSDFSSVWIDVVGGRGEISGFTIQGPNWLYPMLGSGQALIKIADTVFDIDFEVYKIGSLLPSFQNSAVSIESCGVNGSLTVQNAGPDFAHGADNWMVGLNLLDSYGNLNDVLVSNMYYNCIINGCVSRVGGLGSQQLNFYGGLIDEQVAPQSLRVTNGSVVNFFGTTIWAGQDYGIYIDPTSKAYLWSCDAGSYFLTNLGIKAALIDAGGELHASGSTFRADLVGGPVSIDNNGKFFDGGGNNYLNGGSGANVAVPWQQAFLNPTQIWRS